MLNESTPRKHAQFDFRFQTLRRLFLCLVLELKPQDRKNQEQTENCKAKGATNHAHVRYTHGIHLVHHYSTN